MVLAAFAAASGDETLRTLAGVGAIAAFIGFLWLLSIAVSGAGGHPPPGPDPSAARLRPVDALFRLPQRAWADGDFAPVRWVELVARYHAYEDFVATGTDLHAVYERERRRILAGLPRKEAAAFSWEIHGLGGNESAIRLAVDRWRSEKGMPPLTG